MRFTVRTLFALVFACAVLTGFAALPKDFQGFLSVAAFLAAGCACCIYAAVANDTKGTRVALILFVGWAVWFAVLVLYGPLGTLVSTR